jgi:hypothetical protein
MLVRADDAGALYPENVDIDILAYVKRQMPDGRVVAKRNPRTFRVGPADISALNAKAFDRIAVQRPTGVLSCRS